MNDQLRGAAFHEAGHVIVARSFGLEIATIEIGIGGDDAKGKAEISVTDHLPLVDRLAIWAAGIEAQRLFKCPTHERAGLSDFAKIHEMLECELTTEAERDDCYIAGFRRAGDILRMQTANVERLAQCLIEHRKIHGEELFWH